MTNPTPHGQAPQQEAQEPATVDKKTMELAESVGLIGPASRVGDLHAAIQRFHDLICVNATIKAAVMAAQHAAPQQEAQEPCGWTTGITWRPDTRLQSEQVIKITRDAQPNYGYTTPIYTAPQQGAQEPDHSLRTDALCQLAYCNGMKAGWNYCVDGNEVDFARAMEGVSEAMKVLRELRENAPQPAPLSEREAFERDWEKRHAPVPINGRTHDDGRYGDLSIQDAWESWQARAAIAAQGGNK